MEVLFKNYFRRRGLYRHEYNLRSSTDRRFIKGILSWNSCKTSSKCNGIFNGSLRPLVGLLFFFYFLKRFFYPWNSCKQQSLCKTLFPRDKILLSCLPEAFWRLSIDWGPFQGLQDLLFIFHFYPWNSCKNRPYLKVWFYILRASLNL